MKKYISYMTVLLSMLAFTACSEDNGTAPGGDSQASVIMYNYEAAEPLNPDNDVCYRFVFNNQTSAAYYLAEKTADKEARQMSEDAYADYVVNNGTKIELKEDQQSGGYDADLTLTGLYGEYTITAVAVGGNVKKTVSATFLGLDWNDVATGTYTFGNSNVQFLVGMATNTTTLQVCTTDETLYRFKDVFGEGKHLKINLLPDYQNTDEDGTYTFFRVKDQKIAQYNGNDAYVRDVGYWQGDDSFVTDAGYESGMYEDYNCFLLLQCHIGSTNYGYKYDFFEPDAE